MMNKNLEMSLSRAGSCSLIAQSIAPRLALAAADDLALRGMHPAYTCYLFGRVPDSSAAAVVVQPAVAANTAAVAAVVGRVAERLEPDKCAAAAGGVAVVVVAVAPGKVAPAMALIRNSALHAGAGKIVVVRLVADSCCSTLQLDLGHCLRWVFLEGVP